VKRIYRTIVICSLRGGKLAGITLAAALILSSLASSALAQYASPEVAQKVKQYNVQTYIDWVNKYRDAKPEFKPGDVITQKDLEKIRPFVPPGYFEQMDFPEFKMEIIAKDMTPPEAYRKCTEKYGSQVKLAPNGALQNYICGQPFPLSDLKEGDPTAGIKTAWNYNFRNENYGVRNLNAWGFMLPGGTHAGWVHEQPPAQWFVSDIDRTGFCPPDIGSYWGGQGTMERLIEGIFQKFKYTHIADLGDSSGGVLPIPNAKDFEFKEWDAFFRPFDIRGTAFIQFRYDVANPQTADRNDDSWAYIPVLRRVRRISTEVKSDSLLGTEFTLDDYWGFNGRVVDWDWKFLGFKDVLGTQASKWDFAHYFGPMGTIPDDQWRLNRCAVVIRTPHNPRHSYSAAVMFIDTETWFCVIHFPFDRANKLYKTCQWQYRWSEDAAKNPNFTKDNAGTYALDFAGVTGFNVQTDHATVIPGYAGGHPRLSLKDTESLFDISNLENLHR